MSATITGIGSGFDIDSWVSQLVSAKTSTLLTPLKTKLNTYQTKNNALSSLKTKFGTLQSALQTFTKTIYDSSSDMWANNTINSSNSAYATATSSGKVSAASIELEIEQIATATTAKSANSIGAASIEDLGNIKFSNLANGQAKVGTFSMFLNRKEYQVEIEENDTLTDVINKINTVAGGKIKAELTNEGKFSINAYKEILNPGGHVTGYKLDEDASLLIGSSADTSNLPSVLKLFDRVGTHGYESSYPISSINSKVAMISDESGLGEITLTGDEENPSKITINGVDFTIDEKTSLDSLISKINGNSDANVKATYDSLMNKVILTSTETGQNNISLSETNTNLLNILKLTEGEGENEIIAEGSQTLGQNAIVHINGNKIVSTSNTIKGETSGIANLSITVKKPTNNYTGNDDDPVNVSLDIEPDYSNVKNALEKFVSAYNDVINTTKTYTQSGGDIGRDSTLNSLVSSLKNITAQTSNNDGMYKILAQIGISTSKTNATNLSIDSSKLDEALSENFESVKFLLSDGYTATGDTGVLDKMLSLVNNSLDVEKGYFKQATDSIESLITNTNSRIERANTRLTSYETRITKQFNDMDSVISSLSSQLSTFQSYFG